MNVIEALIVAALALVVLYTTRWWPKRRKQNRYVGHKSDPNVHVPRLTVWGRAKQYYGDTE